MNIVCVCVCCLPIHSGHQVRWTYQPGSQEEGHMDVRYYRILLLLYCVVLYKVCTITQ